MIGSNLCLLIGKIPGNSGWISGKSKERSIMSLPVNHSLVRKQLQGSLRYTN